MSRGIQLSLFGAAAVAGLIAVAGCSHNFYSGEREGWRRDAEVSCLNSGAVKDGPERVRITAISGPGMCGADFPIRVSALGESAPLSYDDEPLRPPGAVPDKVNAATLAGGRVECLAAATGRAGARLPAIRLTAVRRGANGASSTSSSLASRAGANDPDANGHATRQTDVTLCARRSRAGGG